MQTGVRDLELQGATVMPSGIFEALVGYIEDEEIRPLLATTFPLERIREAQTPQIQLQQQAPGGDLDARRTDVPLGTRDPPPVAARIRS